MKKMTQMKANTIVGVCCLLMSIGCSKTDATRADGGDSSVAQSARVPVSTAKGIDPTLWLTNGPGHTAEIDSATSRADLVERYGAANVVDDSLRFADAPPVPGTVLFPKDSTRRLEIVWVDEKTQSRPERIDLRGNSGRWAVDPGLRLGMRLTELERINGRPFIVMGFDWDYGGTVTDWKGGKLATPASKAPKISLQLSPAETDTGAVRTSLSGDREFSSAIPSMRELNPHVVGISVSYSLPRQ